MPDNAFSLCPSRRHLMALLFLLTLSFFIVIVSNLFIVIKIVILLALSGYGKYLVEHALLKHPGDILSLARQTDGEWFLQSGGGDFRGVLLGSSTVSAFVSILRFQLADKKTRTAIILSDSLKGSDAYRCLLRAVYQSL